MIAASISRYPDGTRCVEGTRRVPRGFRPCCRVFASHTTSCAYDVRYEWWQRRRTWVVTIAESAGGGGIEIRFCPHCGRSLQPGGSSNSTLQRTGLAVPRPLSGGVRRTGRQVRRSREHGRSFPWLLPQGGETTERGGGRVLRMEVSSTGLLSCLCAPGEESIYMRMAVHLRSE